MRRVWRGGEFGLPEWKLSEVNRGPVGWMDSTWVAIGDAVKHLQGDGIRENQLGECPGVTPVRPGRDDCEDGSGVGSIQEFRARALCSNRNPGALGRRGVRASSRSGNGGRSVG